MFIYLPNFISKAREFKKLEKWKHHSDLFYIQQKGKGTHMQNNENRGADEKVVI